MLPRIRLLIADDHALMREGLKQLFALVPDIQVLAEATRGDDVLGLLDQHQVDLLLLDMAMPGISGENLITRIRHLYPELRILILSMHNELPIARRALKAGANGYVTKDQDPETLLNAIRKVAAGGRHIDMDLAEQLVFEIASTPSSIRHEQLTEREFEIFQLLAQGTSVNDISVMLAISNKTVSTHKARLMEKMGFASNADLVRYAVQHSLMD